MNAFPLPSPPRTGAPRRLIGGVVIAMAIVLSIGMLVSAGLQRDDLRDGTTPGPLPDVPSVVQADQTVAGAEIAPAPGADIMPIEGSVSPR